MNKKKRRHQRIVLHNTCIFNEFREKDQMLTFLYVRALSHRIISESWKNAIKRAQINIFSRFFAHVWKITNGTYIPSFISKFEVILKLWWFILFRIDWFTVTWVLIYTQFGLKNRKCCHFFTIFSTHLKITKWNKLNKFSSRKFLSFLIFFRNFSPFLREFFFK